MPTPPDPAAPDDAPPVVAVEGEVTLANLGHHWVRHQAAGPLLLDYDGGRPMILYLFNAARTPAGTTYPRGGFSLLLPGHPFHLQSAEPTEVLAVAFDPPQAPLALPRSPGLLSGQDPGIRALAHELRRVMLTEGEAAQPYLERLADTLVVRALQVACALSVAPKRLAARRADLAPFSLRRVREHIDSRLSERITVCELAAIAGLSRSYFSRAFQAATGESPHRFVLARRLAEARRRLERGADDLAQLAVQTGFSSHAHLTTAFSQAFGLSPQAYRRQRAAQMMAAVAAFPTGRSV